MQKQLKLTKNVIGYYKSDKMKIWYKKYDLYQFNAHYTLVNQLY